MFGIQLPFYFVWSLLALGAILLFGMFRLGMARRINSPRLLDTLVPLFIVIAMISTAFTDGPQWLYMILIGWFAAYLVARGFAGDSTSLISNIGLILSLWAIVEFLTGFHPFVEVAEAGNWAAIQVRGTWERSEASLGHAIALGGVIAGALPFALDRTKNRYVYTGVLLLGVLATLSRGPIAAALLAIVMWILTNNKKKSRGMGLALLAVAASAVFIVFQEVSGSGDIEELGRSAGARSIQYEETFGLIEAFGTAASSQTNQEFGTQVFGSISVIDSYPLFLGLYFGAVPMLIFMTFVLGVILLAFRSGSASAVAVAASVPIMLVTSPITQWQFFLFFMIGLAVRSAGLVKEVDRHEDSSALGGASLA